MHFDFDLDKLIPPLQIPFLSERPTERVTAEDAHILSSELLPEIDFKQAAVDRAVLTEVGPEIPVQTQRQVAGNVINAAARAQDYEIQVQPQVDRAAQEILAALYGAYLAHGGDPNLSIEAFAQMQPAQEVIEEKHVTPPVEWNNGETIDLEEARRKVLEEVDSEDRRAALQTNNSNLGLFA
ncbi:MAG TPA: hypothetical protein VG604_04000 [Candidatus Saccharimonadales bacterium]|nr:hypothetical protein [Candidatus Saccharimonadales bacterium]